VGDSEALDAVALLAVVVASVDERSLSLNKYGSGEIRTAAAAATASSSMLLATARPSDSTRADSQPANMELLQNEA
jgi:hypothetical protein